MPLIYRTALLALLIAWSANSRAEVTLCTEVVPPATITQPGIYCLLKSHVIGNSSPAIAIRANNVVLDLNGHRIGSGNRYHIAGSPPGIAIDIKDVQNVTIRNGIIRGFATGISLSGQSSQNLVEDMLIEGVSGFGIDSGSSQNSVFRRNRIYGLNPQPVGGSLVGTGGIYALGDGISIQSNIIQSFTGNQYSYGIFSSGRSLVENNFISGFFAPESLETPVGVVAGISCYGESIASGNKVMNISSNQANAVVVGIQADEHTKLIGNFVSVVSGLSYVGGTQIPGTNY